MGAAGVLQGVSAASIAVLLGEYQNVIRNLAGLRLNTKAVMSPETRNVTSSTQYLFLLFIIIGVVAGVVIVRPHFAVVTHEYPVLASCFFLGLMLMAAFLWLRKVTRWTPGVVLCLVAGIGAAFGLTCVRPIITPDNPLAAAVTGALAGTTFMLPGVSDVFIAMFFAKYRYILASFGSLEFDVIIPFIAAGIFGALAVARLLAKLLEAYYNPIVALLGGWMIGSLNRIWPWRQVVEFTTTIEGDRIPAFEKSIMPWRYLQITGKDPHLFHAILIVASGVFMVVLIEKIAARLKTKR